MTNVKPVFESVEELASAIGLSRAATYAALRQGTIPSIRVGKRFILPRVAIQAWLDGAGQMKEAA